MIRIILIILIIIIMNGVLFLKDILSFFNKDNIANINQIENISSKIDQYKDLENKINNFESYSIIDLYSKDNIKKVKDASDFIDQESLSTSSGLNLYAQKIVNLSEKITFNTFEDIKNIAENNISSISNKDIKINLEDLKSKILTDQKEVIKDKVKTEINNSQIKGVVIEKTSFIDNMINSIKSQLDNIIKKKEEILNIQNTEKTQEIKK